MLLEIYQEMQGVKEINSDFPEILYQIKQNHNVNMLLIAGNVGEIFDFLVNSAEHGLLNKGPFMHQLTPDMVRPSRSSSD